MGFISARRRVAREEILEVTGKVSRNNLAGLRISCYRESTIFSLEKYFTSDLYVLVTITKQVHVLPSWLDNNDGDFDKFRI